MSSDAVKLLDHGLVRLVDHMGSDLSVARAAKVSYAAAWRAGEDVGSDERLIRYLWRNAHTTPFEAVTLTFEIKAPIFVLRQWHRHRTQSYNELSARYRELPEEFYIPKAQDIGVQSTDNKQGRSLDPAMAKLRSVELVSYDEHCESAFDLYRSLLESKWPRELARMVLPMSTYSHMFATMNLLNLFRFLTLRSDPHAQMEIRAYAEVMVELARRVAPISVSAWEAEFNSKRSKET